MFMVSEIIEIAVKIFEREHDRVLNPRFDTRLSRATWCFRPNVLANCFANSTH